MNPDANDPVSELRAELAATQQRLRQLEAEHEAVAARAGRRNFLRLAAAGTVAGGAAVLASAESASAATGGNMIIGTFNAPTANADTTGIDSPSATELARAVFAVRNFTSFTSAVETQWRVAMYGTAADADSSGGHRMAIVGEVRSFTDTDKKGIGVFGTANRTINPTLPSEPIGVLGLASAQGDSGSGTGVKGFVFDGSSTIGVHGLTTNTVGVQAEATASGGVGLNAVTPTTGLAVRVDGRLRQVTGGAPGAPSFAVGNAGEQWRDSNGDLWICTVSGAPGTWRKVVAQHPAFPEAGGSLNFLAKPIRVLDTRGNGAPQTNGGNPLAANTDVVFDVAEVVVDGVSVPAGAKGAFGTLTAIAPAANGFMTMWAADVAQPGTASLNFRTGGAVNNSFICALSATGQVRMRSSQSSNVTLDIVGFLY
jgi:hypothetical protein